MMARVHVINLQGVFLVYVHLLNTWWTFLGTNILISGFMWPSCLSFNLDTRTSIVHHGPNSSMFGFSVAVHKDNDFSWLLVGAPEAQTEQPNVQNGGGVYRCSIDSSDVCQMIPFDRAGPGKIIRLGRKEYMDDKSHQWFGATVHSSGENGAIVTCAPRYVYFSSNLQRRDPVGTCWVVRGSFTNFQEYSPCRTTAWGYHRQGYCQAGFAAAVTKDGRRLFMGAVGSWYWQGQVFSQDLLSKQSLHSTPESSAEDDDSYLGYSMAVGEFTGDKNPDIAVGVPRGNNLVGKVSLFNSTVRGLLNISGDQLGSYFGYALCVSDFNGDGLDDVAVGAPLYTNLKAKDGSFENGRVSVVYQSKQHLFEKRNNIDGTYSRGRFGLSLAYVSDVNRDGYNDLAVGSPYGGKDSKGVVFIFHGGSNGINTNPSQEIFPSSISNTNVPSTFGWSLSGGLDLDQNQYPDLLIGAYESDQVIFLRSRPVVQVTTSLKINPEKINLDDKGCKLGEGMLVSCVVVSFCLEFTGTGIDPTISFVYRTTLDSRNSGPRVFFLTDENQNEQNISVSIRKESRYCKSVYAYIQNNVRDKLTPITVQVIYNINDPYPDNVDLKPILDENVSNNISKQVNIQKHCGMDNICIPDLKLQIVPNMHQFLIGSNKRLELNIVISNEGEDAFEAMLHGILPVDVDYVNIAKVRPMDIPVSCSEGNSEHNENKTFICDVGNPLPANTTLTFKILLAPSKYLKASNDLKFDFLINSTNPEIEDTMYDNHLPIILPVRVEVNITIHGISEPQVVSYNKTQAVIETKSRENEAGPEVIHVYAVGNRGPSTVKGAEIDILWPTFTLQNRPLLYLMEQPQVLGKGKCKEVPDVNPFFLKKEKKPRSHGYTVNIVSGSVVHVFGENKDQDERSKREIPLKLWRGNNSTEDMFYVPKLHIGLSETGPMTLRDLRTTKHLQMTKLLGNLNSHPVNCWLSGEEQYCQTDADPDTRDGDSTVWDCGHVTKACGPSRCTRISCMVYNLTKGEQVVFTIRSRLWKDTLIEMGLDEVQISSKLVSKVTSLPHDVDPSYLGTRAFFVTTKVNPETSSFRMRLIPWWLIILSVSAGLILLGLLALFLWWAGFFRRRRPQDQMEEPLHYPYRNGYHMAHGDEYL